ncbi:porin [Burkholderia cepacia]|nr:porin [Burkholderia cepacia]
MKRTCLALATMGVSLVAQAQSSVTLYGRLDAGIEYMSGLPNATYTGSTSRWRAEGGDWGTSLWGLLGTEDIGGGSKVIFKLENGFDVTNGTGGNFFNRWATVAIDNDKYGTLRLGRMPFISNGAWDFDPFAQSIWASASLDRGRNWPLSANNISYQSPRIAGFDVYGQYSLSNATAWNGNGSTPQGRQAGLQLTYTNALFQLRGTYDEIRNPTTGSLGDVAVNSPNGPFAYGREYFAGVNVFLGPVKLQAVYQASRTSGEIGVPFGTATTTDHEWGGITWQATPYTSLTGAVYHINGNNGAGNATIYTLGGAYFLSKSTQLDFQVAALRNSKSANFSLQPNATAGRGGGTGADYNANPLPGHGQFGTYVSIQHSF